MGDAEAKLAAQLLACDLDSAANRAIACYTDAKDKCESLAGLIDREDGE